MRASHHPWVFTVAAVLLLTVAAVDLVVPKICGEDAHGYAAMAIPSLETIGGASHDPGSAPSHVDHCYCCCSHVLSGRAFDVSVAISTEPTSSYVTARHVSIAPPATYRPPRVS